MPTHYPDHSYMPRLRVRGGGASTLPPGSTPGMYCICYSYTMVLGIYGSKPTKHEGGARGRGVVYVAINP